MPFRPLELEPVSAAIPRPLTRFIGREQEIAAVARQLREGARLLTLTGPGGVGKTRLAMEVADRTAGAFDQVWYVPLATVRDPALVAHTIVRALGQARTGADLHMTEELRAVLGDRTALLVLDNFEQVADAGPVVVDLIMACPSLAVLVTSREPLQVSGERVHPIPPLSLPSDGEQTTLRTLRDVEAVRLFVERAADQLPTFALTTQNAEAVVELCRRLDGLPLAIELAAARISAFDPGTIRDRLDARLALLTGGARDQPERLRSVRASIAWSHDQLDRSERHLFQRLGVFTGMWTLDAAQRVAGDGVSADVFLDGIASLVRRNLIRHETNRDGTSRYGMLETIRAFAWEQLEHSAEMAAVRDRHAAYYLELARHTDLSWFLPVEDGGRRLSALQEAHADARSALEWLRLRGDATAMQALAGRLGGLWVVCGYLDEGETWLEYALAAGPDVNNEIRARALATRSWIANQRGEDRLAFDRAEQGLLLVSSGEPTVARVFCLVVAGVAALRLGEFRHAVGRLEAAIALLRTMDPQPWALNWANTLLDQLGMIALLRGDIDEATARFGQAHDEQVARGFAPGHSHIYGNHVLAGLGDVARACGEPAAALGNYRASLTLAWHYRNVRSVTYALSGMAGALAALGRHAEAARLFGASEGLHGSFGYRFVEDTLNRQRALGLPEPWLRAHDTFGVWQPLRDAVVARHARAMPPIPNPDTAAAAWAAGQRLSLDAAVAEALSSAGPEARGNLTVREHDVLRYLAEGLTDAEIAAALYISPRTVATHIQHLYTKLGVSSRAAAAAHGVREGLV